MQPKKVGRPVSDNPKNTVVKFRLDKNQWAILKECAKKLNTSRSDVIRRGIGRIHADLK